MKMQSETLGRIKVSTVPMPVEMAGFFSGTYTYSGRVLVSGKTVTDPQDKDWYRVFTMEDDGTDVCTLFTGEIPQKQGANGIRWMCYPDNKRILLGDYVLECEPDLDHCTQAKLVEVRYPKELMERRDIFMHWSEIIIAPDNVHMCWTALTMTGAVCYMGRLVKKEAEGKESYVLEDTSIVSSLVSYLPDPENPGFVLEQPVRGGEVKQFVKGGRALSVVGNGDSIAESVVQFLDSEEMQQITNTPGYEETTMFSPDETLGVVMSPRFSTKTNCNIFGLVPQPYSMPTRGKMINILYMYCVAGVRAFRKGNVGPALIEIERSMKEGRNYKGVDLSDPEGEYVYYSPISWHPGSTKAMWNEGTRVAAGNQKFRLQICELLDRKPGEPVAAGITPDSAQIPYAQPLSAKEVPVEYPVKIKGKHSGYVENTCTQGEGNPVFETVYHEFSDDGQTFMEGWMRVQAAANLFAPGKTVFETDLTVRGAHTGEMKLKAVFDRESVHAPAMLQLGMGEDGLPISRGYASYDGETLKIEDMEA